MSGAGLGAAVYDNVLGAEYEAMFPFLPAAFIHFLQSRPIKVETTNNQSPLQNRCTIKLLADFKGGMTSHHFFVFMWFLKICPNNRLELSLEKYGDSWIHFC